MKRNFSIIQVFLGWMRITSP